MKSYLKGFLYLHLDFGRYRWFREWMGGDWYRIEVWGMGLTQNVFWSHWNGPYRGYSQVEILEEEHY